MNNSGQPNATSHSFQSILYHGAWFLIPTLLWFIAAPFGLMCFKDEGIYRFINGHFHPLLDKILSYVTLLGTGYFAILILLPLLFFQKYRNKRYLLAAILCNTVPAIFAQIIKNMVNAPRPLKYFDHADWIHIVEGQPFQYHLSFPSGHTVTAFALCCFLTLLLGQKHRYWGMAFFLVALAIGYSRIYLSQHFFTDVFAGSFIGTVGCLGIYWLVSRKGSIVTPSKKDTMQ